MVQSSTALINVTTTAAHTAQRRLDRMGSLFSIVQKQAQEAARFHYGPLHGLRYRLSHGGAPECVHYRVRIA